MATVPGRTAAREPCRTSRSRTWARADGGPPNAWAPTGSCRRSGPDPTCTRSPVRVTGTTAVAPGTSVRVGAVTTWSASRPACCWSRVARSSLVCRKTRVEEKATASTMGVIAEASLRAFVRELAAARPAAGPAARSGSPKRKAHSRAISGPSRATASMNSMTTPSAAFAESSPDEAAARPEQAIPPPRAARPRGCGSSPAGPVPRQRRRGPDRAGSAPAGGRRPSRRAGRSGGRGPRPRRAGSSRRRAGPARGRLPCP